MDNLDEREARRLTVRDEAGAALGAGETPMEDVLERLVSFEDLVDDVCGRYADTLARIESLRAAGKVKTVTYRQLVSNKVSLKETLDLFEERGLL